jgi:hypothetical protein
MKKIVLLFLPAIWLASGAVAQSNGLYVEKKSCTTPIEYNNYLIDLLDMVDALWTKAIEGPDLKSTLQSTADLKKVSGKILQSLKKLEAYGGDVNFKASAIDYVTHLNKISKKELPTFLKLIHAKGGLTPENEKKAEALIPILDDQRETKFAAIERFQEDFATQHNFTIAK